MQAVELKGFGSPEVFYIGSRPRPHPGPGEALIQVHASGVNRPDILQRKGHYPPPAGASDILGLEISGIIVEADTSDLERQSLRLGDAVCALVSGGGYAQWCCAPLEQCLPVPDGWSWVEAATLPETFFTVWSNVFDRAHLQPGESILVHGGSSGIGVTAIQMAQTVTQQIIVTVGNDEKARACLDLGAKHAILYKSQDFVAEVKSLTQGYGVNVILDMVAGPYLTRNLSCLAVDGRLALIAVQGGTQCHIDAGLLLRQRLSILGSTLRARPIAFKSDIAKKLQQHIWPLLSTRKIRPVIDSVFKASEIRKAHERMESGDHIGKLVLEWEH